MNKRGGYFYSHQRMKVLGFFFILFINWVIGHVLVYIKSSMDCNQFMSAYILCVDPHTIKMLCMQTRDLCTPYCHDQFYFFPLSCVVGFALKVNLDCDIDII